MPAWEANTDKILNEDGSLTLEVKETYAIDLVPKKNPSGSRGIPRIDYAAGVVIEVNDVFEENDSAAFGAKCNLCDKMVVGRENGWLNMMIHLAHYHPEFVTKDEARIRRLFLIAEDGEDVKKIFGILHTRTSTARVTGAPPPVTTDGVSHDSIFEIKRPTDRS